MHLVVLKFFSLGGPIFDGVIKTLKGSPKMAIFGPNNFFMSTSPRVQILEQQILDACKTRRSGSVPKEVFKESGLSSIYIKG